MEININRNSHHIHFFTRSILHLQLSQYSIIMFKSLVLVQFLVAQVVVGDDGGSNNNICTNADFEEIYYGPNSMLGYTFTYPCVFNATTSLPVVNTSSVESCFAKYSPVELTSQCTQCFVDMFSAYSYCDTNICSNPNKTYSDCEDCMMANYTIPHWLNGGCFDADNFFIERNGPEELNPWNMRDDVEITRTDTTLPVPLSNDTMSSACSTNDLEIYWRGGAALADVLNIEHCFYYAAAVAEIDESDVEKCFTDNNTTAVSLSCRQCIAYDQNVDILCRVCGTDGTDCTSCFNQLNVVVDKHRCIGDTTDPRVLALFEPKSSYTLNFGIVSMILVIATTFLM